MGWGDWRQGDLAPVKETSKEGWGRCSERSSGARWHWRGQLTEAAVTLVSGPGRVAAPCREQALQEERCVVASQCSLTSLQDLAWMITFYIRIFLTYLPLLGLKGFLGLFFMVR